MSSLHAPHVLEYTYKRSVGPVVGAFFEALRDRRLVGIRSPHAGVICPPAEYDPVSSESLDLDGLVDVGPEGTVTTWTWQARPREGNPLDRPFGWALILLDGADTTMLHAVDAGSAKRMATGMRVRVRWADETVGDIGDIACFEPVEG